MTPKPRLTANQVEAARAAITAGIPITAIGRTMGVSEWTVRRMVGRRFTHTRVSQEQVETMRPLIIDALIRNDPHATIAAALGVSQTTVTNIWNKDPELAEARKRKPVRRPGESASHYGQRLSAWKRELSPALKAEFKARRREALMEASRKRRARQERAAHKILKTAMEEVAQPKIVAPLFVPPAVPRNVPQNVPLPPPAMIPPPPRLAWLNWAAVVIVGAIIFAGWQAVARL